MENKTKRKIILRVCNGRIQFRKLVPIFIRDLVVLEEFMWISCFNKSLKYEKLFKLILIYIRGSIWSWRGEFNSVWILYVCKNVNMKSPKKILKNIRTCSSVCKDDLIISGLSSTASKSYIKIIKSNCRQHY